MQEGWEGWDDYARFYDWENTQTLGRRDLTFWRRLTAEAPGRVLELGCGTGRVTIPLARAGVEVVGVDRSAQMLERARLRAARFGGASRVRTARSGGARLVHGDIRHLPFRPGSFATVIAPYGILQSLIQPRDLGRTLRAVAAVTAPGGTLAVDLVPDVPQWREYSDRVTFRGRARGADVTLVESVRQDRQRRLTTFDERYIERRDRRTTERRFSLVFRTLSVDETARALGRAGFAVEAVLGDYRGRPWDDRADVWIILSRRRQSLV